MKARQCEECAHHTLKWYRYRGGEQFDVLKCGKGHKPRFYLPRSPLDFNFGWKKVCGDFMPSNAPGKPTAANEPNEGVND